MIAQDLISNNLPVIKTSDTGEEALAMMDIYRVSHLPIVNNQKLLGLISDTDIYDNNCEKDPIGNHKLSLMRPYVYYNQHIYEIIDLLHNLKLTVVPVLSENKNYYGTITAKELIAAFASMSSIQQSGSIIILDINIHDYSSSQISQIVESHDCKILSMYVNSNKNSSHIEVTLRIDNPDASAVLQTFSRFDYKVISTFRYKDLASSMYKNRYESFMNYLNI